MVSIRFVIVKFTDLELLPTDIPKLRGYFAHKYPQEHSFHNHLPNGSFNYKYPLIQYRIIDRHPALLGMGTGIDILKQVFFELDSISISGVAYQTFEREVKVIEADFGASEQLYSYEFSSPWMALNERNYEEYIALDAMHKQRFLRHLLRENLKTLSKGFDYTIPDIDAINVDGWFKPYLVKFKDIEMLCFKGEFMLNFAIPDYLGLGKQSARGFGVVKGK
jgi:hypothetical protein